MLLLSVVHILDLVSVIFDFLGFILKNFSFYGFKCIVDVPSVIIAIIVQIIYFKTLIQDNDSESEKKTD